MEAIQAREQHAAAMEWQESIDSAVTNVKAAFASDKTLLTESLELVRYPLQCSCPLACSIFRGIPCQLALCVILFSCKRYHPVILMLTLSIPQAISNLGTDPSAEQMDPVKRLFMAQFGDDK
jgi:hypothetical protein